MTGTLFEQLERAGLQIDPLNVGDAIWLARFIPGDAAFTSPTEEKTDVGKKDSGPAPGSSPPSDPQEPPPGTEQETPREPTPEPKPDTHIYAELGNLSASRTVPASPIRVPATTALPGFLDLSRALRPLNARRPSVRFFELDEAATVEQAARHDNLLMPMFRPRPERWFNAALVVEQSPSMDVWGQAVAEFNKLLERQGAFSDVRMWRFHLDAPGGNLVGESGAARPPEMLIDPSGRRLIFFVTNGLSPAWRRGELGRTLAAWGRSSPVVVVHALPPELWKRTVLGEARATAWSLKAGRPNHALSSSTELSLDPQDSRFLAPVMHWTPEAFGSWARMFMARGRVTAPAFLVRTVKPPERRRSSSPVQTPRAIDPAARLSPLDHSSEEAQKLAAHMAAAPLTLPVIRLVQAALFGDEARPSQIAEVMLSGLVERITPLIPPVHPDTVQYRFDDDVRPLLLERLRKSSARNIVELLTPYIRDHQGNLVDFRALVRDAKGRFELPESTQPFAELAVGLMRSLGLMPVPQPVPEPQKLPAAQVFEAHTEVVNKVAITQDGRFAASASSDGTIRIWDLVSCWELGIEQFDRPVTSLAISFDGQRIAGGYGNILVHRSGFGGTPVVTSQYAADTFNVTAVAIDATGNMVFAGFGDGAVRTWDLENQGADVLAELPSTIVDVSATRDGRRIVAASEHSVHVFVDQKQLWQVSSASNADVCALWIDPHNGQRIAVLDKTGAVSFYTVSTGAFIYSIPGIFSAFTVTPDGRFLAGVRETIVNEIVLWDVNEHRLLHSFSGHQAAVTSLAISADGSTIVPGGWDKTVRVWRVPVDLPRGGRIALIALENHAGDTVWMVDMLADAGHVVRYARWGTETQEAVEQSEAVIFVDLAGHQPMNLYLRLSLQYSGKPVFGFYDHQPTQVELLEGAARLIAEARAGGPLQGLPHLPPRYFPRPELETRLADRLIDPDGSIVLILQGGGRGTLLSAVARSAKVRRHFSGGIVWGDTVPSLPEIKGPRLWCAPEITGHREFLSQDRCAALEPANFVQQPISIFEVPPLTRAECALFLSQGNAAREPPDYALLYDIHEANWSLLARIDALSEVCEPAVLVKMLADRRSALLESPLGTRADVMLDPAWHALRLENRNFLRMLFVCRTSHVPSIVARFLEKQFQQISVDDLVAAGYLIKDPDGSLQIRIQATARTMGIAEPGFHRQVVDAYTESLHGQPPHLGTNDGYYFENLIYHMMAAHMEDEAAALAQSRAWQFQVTVLLGAPAAERQLALATRSPVPSAPARWILVVGTGRQNLSREEVFASDVLGTELARSGFGLISGGWKGVDHVVAREFAKQRRRQGNEVDEALKQILAPGQEPHFQEGSRIYSKRRGQEGKDAVKQSDAVIMVGGLGGTYDAFRWAMNAKKPVYPLAGTGRDADKAFRELVKAGSLDPNDELGLSIGSQEDAQRIIESLISRLKTLRGDNTETSGYVKPDRVNRREIAYSGLLCFERTQADLWSVLADEYCVTVVGAAGSGKTTLLQTLVEDKTALQTAGFDDAIVLQAADLDGNSGISLPGIQGSLGRVLSALRTGFKRSVARKLVCIDGLDEFPGDQAELWEMLRNLQQRDRSVKQYLFASRSANFDSILNERLGLTRIARVTLPILQATQATELLRGLAKRCEVSLSRAEVESFVSRTSLYAHHFAGQLIQMMRQKIEEAAAKRARTGARFFNSSEIRAQIMSDTNMPKTDLVIDVKLVFSTEKQRTWIASSLHHVYCVLDDEKTRLRDRLIQWHDPLNPEPRVAIRDSTTNQAVFDINQRRNWLYSTDLHPNEEALKQTLKRLASPNDLA
jgi:hypothetical protein